MRLAGSFGTYPTCIRAVLQYYQNAAESRPDKFIRYDYPNLLDKSRQALADLLKVDVAEIVLLSNATLGINTVLRALEYEPGDVIIYFSSIYGACEKTVQYITEITPAESKRIAYTYPAEDQAVYDLLADAIKSIKAQGKHPKLAIFDTISSMPGVRVPFERLTELCRANGVLSCLDAAHSVGQIELDLSQLRPDFFVSNCHKWLHVPRGCAVFYVPLRNQALIRSTLPTSHGFLARPIPGSKVIGNPLPPSTKSSFVNNFEFVGTLDNSPYLCVPSALEWRSKLVWKEFSGETAVYQYIQHIAGVAASIVSAALGTKTMENETGTLSHCSMRNVSLPLSYHDVAGNDLATAVRVAQWMSKILVDEYDTFMAILIHNDEWWVRLSGQVYLTKEDFEHGAGILRELCVRVKAGEWRET